MNKLLVVNLYAGPGAFKSTIATGVFTLLKLHGIECECIYEFPKELVWEESLNTLKDQNYIFSEQAHRLWRIKNKAEVVLMDSPLLLSLIYKQKDLGGDFINHVVSIYSKYNNLNIFIERALDKKFIINGRVQDFQESIVIDNEIKKMLDKYCNKYTNIKAGYTAITMITSMILQKLNIKLKYDLIKL